MIQHIDEASDAIANIRDDWQGIQASYDAYRRVLIEAGIPMFLDDEGKPAQDGERNRDLIDGIVDLAKRHRDAEGAARDIMRAIPDRCPVTGREFMRIEEHPERGWVALYKDESEEGVTLYSIPEILPEAGHQEMHERPMARLAYSPGSDNPWTLETVSIRMIRQQYLDVLGDRDKDLRQLEAVMAHERDQAAEQLGEARRHQQIAESEWDKARGAIDEWRKTSQSLNEEICKASKRNYDLNSELTAVKAQADKLAHELGPLRGQVVDLRRDLAEARKQVQVLKAQRGYLGDSLEEIAAACAARTSRWSKPVDPKILNRAEMLARLAKNGDGAPS